ncbi:hypothetical protein MNBD_CHLOROFLEXI01-3677 [hydrothermal vent metagenome]|uniref:DUF4276 family protein n=1 Tax=hydrothermal vent metagenome TaxID=652676 RepID=A0A3B0VQ79_9ZZZZ
MSMGAALRMNRLLVVVEGQTELTFVREVLAPYLDRFNLLTSARLIGKPGYKGGIPPFPKFLREVVAILRQDSTLICTMMFDFYGMPFNWPQRESAGAALQDQKPIIIENGIAEKISQELGPSFNRNRFIPYVQIHEFEALLFSDPQILATAMLKPDSIQLLNKINEQFEHPELINDNVNTAPSKRLLGINPAYQKIIHGNLAAKRMGLQTMREKCPHFNSWVAKLEQVGDGKRS